MNVFEKLMIREVSLPSVTVHTFILVKKIVEDRLRQGYAASRPAITLKGATRHADARASIAAAHWLTSVDSHD